MIALPCPALPCPARTPQRLLGRSNDLRRDGGAGAVLRHPPQRPVRHRGGVDLRVFWYIYIYIYICIYISRWRRCCPGARGVVTGRGNDRSARRSNANVPCTADA